MYKTYFDYDYTETLQESSDSVNSATASSDSKGLFILGIILLLICIATLVICIISFLKISILSKRIDSVSIKIGNIEAQSSEGNIGVVFCKKCGSNYNSKEIKCPYCGTKK